jgi:hypothetical protein
VGSVAPGELQGSQHRLLEELRGVPVRREHAEHLLPDDSGVREEDARPKGQALGAPLGASAGRCHQEEGEAGAERRALLV